MTFKRDNSTFWFEHKFPEELSKESRDKYEAYYRGYLIYYDTRSRNKGVIHDIGFASPEECPDPTVIRAFIFPGPDPGIDYPEDPYEDKDGVMSAQATTSKDPQEPPKPRGF